MTKIELDSLLFTTALSASFADLKTLQSVQRKIGKAEENRMTLAGFSLGLAEHFPGEGVAVDDVRALFTTLPGPDQAIWLDFELGQFAATGDYSYLLRIVRFAKNRDGSTASIVAGHQAASLLDLAMKVEPGYVDILRGYNYVAGAPVLQSNPVDRASYDKLRGDRTAEPAVVTTAVLPTAEETAGLGGMVPALVDSIDPNQAHGSIDSLVGPVSVTDALSLISALTYATRRLILPLPFDGYQWDDYAGSAEKPTHALFTPDTIEGERLRWLQPVAVAAMFIAGRVIEKLGENNRVEFHAAIYLDGEFVHVGVDADLNRAKFLVASAVRAHIESLPAAAAPAAAPTATVDFSLTDLVDALPVVTPPAPVSIAGSSAEVLKTPAESAAAPAAAPAAMAPKKSATKSAAKPKTKPVKSAAKNKPLTKRKG